MIRRKTSSPAEAAVADDEIDLGALPEWNLDDLFPGMESAEYKSALTAAADDSAAFAQRYRGRLAKLAAGGDKLAEAVAEYEELEDRLGRIMSYAGLIHAGDTSDPQRAKFYGDAQDKLTTASTHLLFFTLELNKIDDEVLEAAMKGSEKLDHYRPWLEDIRREKPYQLDDKLEQLFFEKSVTGSGSFTRLFDETQASLRYDVLGKELSVEATLTLLQDPDGKKRKAAAEAMAETFGKNLRLFTLITNTLAKDKEISDRWRRFKDVAASRNLSNRVEDEVVAALVEAVRVGLSAPVAPLLRAEGEVVRHGCARLLGPQCTAPGDADQGDRLGRGAGEGAVGLSRLLAEDGRDCRPVLHRSLDRCPGAQRQIAGRVSRIRQCRAHIPMCSSTIRESRAT